VILEAQAISFSYRSEPVLVGVDLRLDPGVTAIVGPNAAGKSTLLRCLAGQLEPEGRVLLDGRPLRDYRCAERTAAISYLPQDLSTRAVLTVFEVVLLGRLHRLGWHVSREDAERVAALLEEFGIADLSARYVTELSGGQLQLVTIAQALAREPQVLLLDEPTSNLDLRHQFEIGARIREITESRGISTALSVHDINMAARMADVVYVLEGGRVRCSGPPDAVLTEEMIASVYGVSAHVSRDDGGRPLVTPVGLKEELENG